MLSQLARAARACIVVLFVSWCSALAHSVGAIAVSPTMFAYLLTSAGVSTVCFVILQGLRVIERRAEVYYAIGRDVERAKWVSTWQAPPPKRRRLNSVD